MEGKLLPQALIAQSVERMAFNHVVVGSSPTESKPIYFYKLYVIIYTSSSLKSVKISCRCYCISTKIFNIYPFPDSHIR